MHVNHEFEGHVARVRHVDEDAQRVYLEYRSGVTGFISSYEPIALEVGDVVIVDAQSGSMAQVPHEVWPEPTWIGVVRSKTEEAAIVDSTSSLKLIAPGDTDFEVGNTVEVSDSDGVVRVLAEEPIRLIDLGESHTGDPLERFKTPASASGPSFDDFGGLAEVVERAKELIELPLREPKRLKEIGARPIKGVLFTGDPGTGKTHLARIIASQSGAEFYEISGPQIFSKWYGESEQLLRTLFDDAARQSSIIFFDEIDSVAGQREEAHEASRRVVAQLLTLMDGFRPDENVVVIAATNRVQDVDDALRRPGRFDWEIRFPLPSEADREAILRTASRGLRAEPDLPHAEVAAKTGGWSSAELVGIWSEAALLAAADGRSLIQAEDYVGGFARRASMRSARVLLATPKGRV